MVTVQRNGALLELLQELQASEQLEDFFGVSQLTLNVVEQLEPSTTGTQNTPPVVQQSDPDDPHTAVFNGAAAARIRDSLTEQLRYVC